MSRPSDDHPAATVDDDHDGHPAAPRRRQAQTLSISASTLRNYCLTSKGWFGDYDYGALCMPRLPCMRERSLRTRSIFFGVNDHIPILVALLMGFQHALAMAGGVITVPRIIVGAGANHLNLEPAEQAHLISVSLIVCGLMSVIQIVRVRLFRGYYMGTGLISMSGTSFTFLPVIEAMISQLVERGECQLNQPCRSAYGKWLGTVAVGALLEIAISFVNPQILRHVFPPVVTGPTVFLIGAALTGVGLRYWAGGAGPCLTTSNLRGLLGSLPSDRVNQIITDLNLDIFQQCPTVFANRNYAWGNFRWIGLGFFVFAVIVLIELFGSPFLRNTQIVVGLVSGIILSAILGYLDNEFLKISPWITFPLVKTYPLGFYAPAILPVLIAYLISAVETIGDISASCEASKVPTEGAQFESRLQGGLLADGVNSLLAALLTSSPTTTFSENNGVISMTRTANRYAGLAGAAWLVLFGLIGKIGGVLGAMPDAVLGGMTTLLFANVATSGISILSTIAWTRRNRFILAVTIALGLGVVIEPNAFVYFIPSGNSSFTTGLRDGVTIVLSSGFAVGAIVAMVLNLLLPEDGEEVSPDDFNMKGNLSQEKVSNDNGDDTFEKVDP